MSQQGQGFRKNQPKQMTVQVDDVQKMQQGYEDRIARQVASIERLQALLSDRTDQLARQMQDENNRASEWGLPSIEEVRLVDRPSRGPDDDQTWVEFIYGMIETAFLNDYDASYLEETLKEQLIARYIQHLQHEVEHRRAKEKHAVEEVERQKAILAGSEQARLAGERKLAQVQAQLDEANRNLTQAITDARHNAKAVNTAFARVQNDDDIPPWEKAGYVPPTSTVSPTVIERDTPMNVPVHPALAGDSETIQFDGFGGAKGHAGEQRPGRF